MAEEISLYIHLPFCRLKCPYCSFFVLPYSVEAEKMLEEALLQHLKILNPQFANKQLVSVYFGGGTPSIVSLESLERIVTAIKRLDVTFDPGCEWTLEANPEDIDEARARRYQEIGFNRVSLGVQSFVDEELVFLGRNVQKNRSIQAIDAFVKAGITNISIDLIFELMDQTIENFTKTLNVVQKLPITHLSLYDLVIEEGSAFYKKKKTLEARRPESAVGLEMLEKACEKLAEFGFDRYDISAFSKGAYRSRHNIGYWTARPFWGIGPSAWSFIDGARHQCLKNLKKYHENLFSNQSPFIFSEKLDPLSLQKEQVGLALRLKEGVQKTTICFEEINTTLKQLVFKDLVNESTDSFTLTPSGRTFYDSVQIELA